ERIRAYRDDVLKQVNSGAPALVDVRSVPEYTGEVLHMAGYAQEGAQRGGHVLGAKSIPWATAANEDGTFKSPEQLREIYGGNGAAWSACRSPRAQNQDCRASPPGTDLSPMISWLRSRPRPRTDSR
ncbi:MAG: sulfurtransferase, partial [Thermomicrobiales bacterium]|nr:sulfurtransferase [Thermomicrobiales bacterium]